MVVYLLTVLEFLTPEFLKTYRRQCNCGHNGGCSNYTPADVLSMMAAAMPLVILYEMSIWMSIYVSKNWKTRLALQNS